MKKILIFMAIAVFALNIIPKACAKELKIGFADKMRILFEYDKAKDLNKTLKEQEDAAKKEFDKKAEEIKKLRDKMELMEEKARKKQESELEKKLQELDTFRREKQREIGQKYDQGIRDVSKEIAEVCAQYGKDKGFDAILDSRATLYLPESLDVTEDILKKLNK